MFCVRRSDVFVLHSVVVWLALFLGCVLVDVTVGIVGIALMLIVVGVAVIDVIVSW